MTLEVKVGSKIRITKNIYDSCPDNCYPPGYLAFTGEIVVVKNIRGEAVSVAHEHVTHDNSFYVRSDEYELVKEEAA